MMNLKDINFLYDHAKNYGGYEYALWIIARFGHGEPRVPDISHAVESVKFELATGNTSALHHQVDKYPRAKKG